MNRSTWLRLRRYGISDLWYAVKSPTNWSRIEVVTTALPGCNRVPRCRADRCRCSSRQRSRADTRRVRWQGGSDDVDRSGRSAGTRRRSSRADSDDRTTCLATRRHRCTRHPRGRTWRRYNTGSDAGIRLRTFRPGTLHSAGALTYSTSPN